MRPRFGVPASAIKAAVLSSAASLSSAAALSASMLVTLAPATVVASSLDSSTAAVESRNWHMRTGESLKRTWGVEVLGVHVASAGWMLTFRYKVLDAEKSRALFNPRATAYLVDEDSGARLAVPAMENIGELRQARNAEAGRAYYVMFGNANRVVRRGGRVDVVIGDFHADGLIVE